MGPYILIRYVLPIIIVGYAMWRISLWLYRKCVGRELDQLVQQRKTTAAYQRKLNPTRKKARKK